MMGIFEKKKDKQLEKHADPPHEQHSESASEQTALLSAAEGPDTPRQQ